MKIRIWFLAICALAYLPAQAQSPSSSEKSKKTAGSLYFTWNYNRDAYTKSDIHFVSKTDNYDFTFYNAKAHDKPDMDRWWKINRLTIPQYDMHLGYMFNGKHDLGIEIGWDHLKYVVTDNQVMHMKGQIHGETFDKDTLVTPDFIHLQHTNGNNYALVNLVKRQHLWSSRHIDVSAFGKVGLGPLMSVTISKTFGESYRTGFKYQGWVFPVSGGLRITFYDYFFINGDVQGAYVDYIHSHIGATGQGIASQHFYSLQWLFGGGFNLPLGKRSAAVMR
jgi:hypothetical protein